VPDYWGLISGKARVSIRSHLISYWCKKIFKRSNLAQHVRKGTAYVIVLWVVWLCIKLNVRQEISGFSRVALCRE